MAHIFLKNTVFRIITFGTLFLVAIHFTWLFYYFSVTNQHQAQKRQALAALPTNDTPKSRTQHQAQRLNSSMVPPLRGCKMPVFVLIVVFSSPNNFEQRSVIRGTWAEIKANTDPNTTSTNIINNGFYSAKNLVRTLFLLGQTDDSTQSMIDGESRHYMDILTGSFVDSYGNLTLKAKLGMEWAYQFCNFRYYLKTDDDVFVYSKGLVEWLWEKPRERFYTGRCDFNKPVIRTVGHKWS